MQSSVGIMKNAFSSYLIRRTFSLIVNAKFPIRNLSQVELDPQNISIAFSFERG